MIVGVSVSAHVLYCKEVSLSLSISVVIPTHNRCKGLSAALRSVAHQTVWPSEVIVVDDGSQPEVSEEVFIGFPNAIHCILLRNNVPAGGNNARNRGVLAASSEYIAFLDDDDLFKPTKIEEVKRAILSNKKADIIYHSAHIHMVNEGVSYYSKPKAFKEEDDIFRQLLVQNVIGGTPMVTIRRESLIGVGLFDEEMPALQDYELWLRMAKAGAKFLYLDKPLTDYRHVTNKRSVSKSIDTNAKAICLIERKYASDYKALDVNESKCHNVWKMHMKVHKSLLSGQLLQAFRYQARLFFLQPRASSFLLMFLILLGPKAVLKLKARVSK